MDTRDKKLANLLINYSTKVKADENVLIEYEGEEAKPLVREIIKIIYSCGGNPYVNIADSEILREILMASNERQLEFMKEYKLLQMKGMDAYIAVHGGSNVSELSDVSPSKVKLYEQTMLDVLNYRVDKTKWVILRYPSHSMAQLAGKSTEAFRDFFYDVCTLDYEKMNKAMDPLVKLMNETDMVEIKGPNTDLTFSIKGINAVKCSGECNIPDGEVYTAPVKDSMNGHISYNTPSLEQGFTFENIEFEIKNGKIINAKANDTERINKILDTDEGSRFFGEFSLGINPYILHPMKDTLFDEKISGSFHLTPGMCYEDAPNGNSSAVHWDLVNIQREEYGGGGIYFDGTLIRKDGLFVIPELYALNPENLK